MKCFKCGKETKTIKHHLSYNPEVLVDSCVSCHKLIHNRVRKENACPLSVTEVNKLSINSFRRRYTKKNYRMITFYETMIPNVDFHEELRYNEATGNVGWSARFRATNGKGLLYIDEYSREALKS